MAQNNLRITVYVCPDCHAWHPDTAGGFPLHSSCEYEGHGQARAREFIPAGRVEAAVRDFAAALGFVADHPDEEPAPLAPREARNALRRHPEYIG